MLIPTDDQTQVLDRPAALQQGTRMFTALYERNAYLIYNLTLRITCDQPTAIIAAGATFLAAAKTPDGEDGLVKTATSQALARAADRVGEPNGAGDAEAQAMLAATGSLTAVQRAVLALNGLAEAGPVELAAHMDLTEQASASVLERSFEVLARSLRKGRSEAEEAYAGWLWAEPPAELWADLYPSFHRLLDRQLREGEASRANGDTAAVKPEKGPSRRDQRRARRERAQIATTTGQPPKQRRFKPGRRTSLAVALVALAGGGYAIASGTGLIGGDDPPPPEPPLAPEQSFGSNLSPEKLDELRMRELERAAGGGLDEDGADVEDKPGDDLKTRQRKARQRKARRELLELRRKRAERRRELRERASRTPGPAPSSPPPREPDPPEPRDEPKQPEPKGSDKDGDERSIEDCLYNSGSGTYVCPE